MGKMKLGFKIQLNGNVLFAIFRLPPRLFAGTWLRFINDLTDSMVFQRIIFGRLSGVAQEAFLFFQMRDNAKSFRMVKTARGRGVEPILTSNQQISGGWVTRTVFARMGPLLRSIC